MEFELEQNWIFLWMFVAVKKFWSKSRWMDGWIDKHLQFSKFLLVSFYIKFQFSFLWGATCLLLFCTSLYYNMVPDWVLIIDLAQLKQTILKTFVNSVKLHDSYLLQKSLQAVKEWLKGKLHVSVGITVHVVPIIKSLSWERQRVTQSRSL